jgi:hypothetical protein
MIGDWSDSRVVKTTDRTESTIQLVEKIEELQRKCDIAVNMLTAVYVELQAEGLLDEFRANIHDSLSLLKHSRKEKNITFHTGKWTFQYKGKYIGRYKTLDEAVAARDEYIRSKL